MCSGDQERVKMLWILKIISLHLSFTQRERDLHLAMYCKLWLKSMHTPLGTTRERAVAELERERERAFISRRRRRDGGRGRRRRSKKKKSRRGGRRRKQKMRRNDDGVMIIGVDVR